MPKPERERRRPTAASGSSTAPGAASRRHGYEGATVVRLEQEIGLSRGAIFNWFPSKEELFIALAARDNERLLLRLRRAGARGDPRRAARATIPTGSPSTSSSGGACGRTRSSASAGRRSRPDDARERSRGVDRGRRRPAGRLRSDVSAQEIGQFLGVILDGIAVQRALGFDAPEPELLHRLTRDAIGGARSRARVRLKSDTSPYGSVPSVSRELVRVRVGVDALRVEHACRRSRASRGTGSRRPSRRHASTFPWPAW